MLEHLILRDQYSFNEDKSSKKIQLTSLTKRDEKYKSSHLQKKKKLNIYRTISLIHHHYDIHLYKNLVKKQELMRSLQNPQNTEKPKLSQGLHKGAIALYAAQVRRSLSIRLDSQSSISPFPSR